MCTLEGDKEAIRGDQQDAAMQRKEGDCSERPRNRGFRKIRYGICTGFNRLNT
jgi:hypothetical protein